MTTIMTMMTIRPPFTRWGLERGHVIGKGVFGVDRADWALGEAGIAVDAFLGVDVELVESSRVVYDGPE